jgi:hypothetical protein
VAGRVEPDVGLATWPDPARGFGFSLNSQENDILVKNKFGNTWKIF